MRKSYKTVQQLWQKCICTQIWNYFGCSVEQSVSCFQAGEIKFMRMGAEESPGVRCAFVEYTTASSFAAAMTCNGSTLNGRIIRFVTLQLFFLQSPMFRAIICNFFITELFHLKLPSAKAWLPHLRVRLWIPKRWTKRCASWRKRRPSSRELSTQVRSMEDR